METITSYRLNNERDFLPNEEMKNLLNYLGYLFIHISELQDFFFPEGFYDVGEALEEARDQINTLILMSEQLYDDDRFKNTINAYGLNGESLKFKLKAIEFASSQMNSLTPPEFIKATRNNGPGQEYRKATSKVLKFINIPMDSLLKALQPSAFFRGMPEPENISEIKKVLEKIIMF